MADTKETERRRVRAVQEAGDCGSSSSTTTTTTNTTTSFSHAADAAAPRPLPLLPPSAAAAAASPSADPSFRTRWVLLKALAFASGLALPIWAFRRWRSGADSRGRAWFRGGWGVSGRGTRIRTKGMPYEKMARHDDEQLEYGVEGYARRVHGHGHGYGYNYSYGNGNGSGSGSGTGSDNARYEPMGYNPPPRPPPAAGPDAAATAATAADYYKPPPS